MTTRSHPRPFIPASPERRAIELAEIERAVAAGLVQQVPSSMEMARRGRYFLKFRRGKWGQRNFYREPEPLTHVDSKEAET